MLLLGGDFGSGAAFSGGAATLTWASQAMRRSMIEQSLLGETRYQDPPKNQQGPPAPISNASGRSFGFGLDLFKLGGSRLPSTDSPLGGQQGGAGRVFFAKYSAGSFLDALVETYSGPHDFLNSPIFYDSVGNNASRSLVLEVINAANVLVATPFAGASVIPGYAYGIGAHAGP